MIVIAVQPDVYTLPLIFAYFVADIYRLRQGDCLALIVPKIGREQPCMVRMVTIALAQVMLLSVIIYTLLTDQESTLEDTSFNSASQIASNVVPAPTALIVLIYPIENHCDIVGLPFTQHLHETSKIYTRVIAFILACTYILVCG